MAENALATIDQTITEYSLDKLGSLPMMRRTVAVATAMKKLRSLVAGETLEMICELAGSSLGFKTDRDGKGEGYPPEVIRDCIIEGMLRGAQPVGNQINIIAARCYLTKEFYEGQLRQLVQNLRVTPGVPQTFPSGALVPMKASWIYMGKPDEIDCANNGTGDDNRIPVKVNSGMGVDAILGKAYRKLFKRIYDRCTGSSWIQEVEEEPDDEIRAAIASDSSTEKPFDLDDFYAQLATFEQISDVTAFESETLTLISNAEMKRAIKAACERRRDEIHATRGERSNPDAAVV